MRLARICMLALACLLPGAAFAQHAETMLPDLCQRMCTTSLKVCDKGAAPDDPACLTRRVVCAQTCKPCLVSREECGKSGGDFSACLAEYGACSRERTDAGAASHPRVAFAGGDGSSKAQAVVISGAQGEIEGVIAETIWAALKHPDWRKTGQSLSQADGRPFDVIDYETHDGAKAQAWFDIGDFFGKIAPAPKN